MATFELVVVDAETGAPAYPLPDVTSMKLSPIFSAVGVVDFSYPESGINSHLLRPIPREQDVEIAVLRDGVEIDDLRFIIDDYGSNEVSDEEEGKTWSYVGRTMMALLERAVVYPPGFGTPDVEDVLTYTNATAGNIMGTLIEAAQARGGLTSIETGSFSSLTDSNGVAWTKQISIKYRTGLQYDEVLKNLNDQGMVEARMVGRELKLYLLDTMATDRTTGTNPVVFRRGRDLRDSPRKVSRKGVASVFLAGGSEGLYDESVNTEAVALFGRIESFDSQGGVKDPGTLAAYADYQRDLRAQVTMEKSHGLVFGDGTPEPVQDFEIGDWVYSDIDGTLERLRVKQWAVSQGSDGTLEGVVVLNDLFSELQDRIVKRVNGILGGTTLTGESRATDVNQVLDTIPPKTPQDLSGSSALYYDGDGRARAQATLSWTPVTENADGSPITDLAAYLIHYRFDLISEWSTEFSFEPGPAQGSLSGFDPGVHVFFQVAAVDRSGNRSPWSNLPNGYAMDLDYDDTPPPKPSDPITSENVGYIRVTWDGLTDSGGPWPSDFVGVEIHQSTASGFTPGPSTFVGYLNLKGSITVPSISTPVYDTDNFFKFVAYDNSYNLSTPSDPVAGQARQVVKTDIGGNVIDFDNVRFKDSGNLIPDGSFELAETMTLINDLPGTTFEVLADPTGTGPSSKVLRINSGGGVQTLYLNRFVNASDDQKYAVIGSVRAHGLTGGDYVHVNMTSHFPDGSADYNFWMINITAATIVDTWFLRQAAVVQVRPDASRITFSITASIAAPGGYVLLDELEARPVIGTLLIEDAAITSAKIANLAVNNAHIANLNVGKLVSGTMAADVLLAGSIATGTSGERVVVNGSGMFGFDADENEIFYVTTAGEAGIVGNIGAVDYTTGNGVFMKPHSNVYDPDRPALNNPGIVFGFSSSWYVYPGVYAEADGSINLSGYMMSDGDPQGWFSLNKSLGQMHVENGSSAVIVMRSGAWDSGMGSSMGRLRFFGKMDSGGPWGYASAMWTDRIINVLYNKAGGTGYYYLYTRNFGFSLNTVPKMVVTFETAGNAIWGASSVHIVAANSYRIAYGTIIGSGSGEVSDGSINTWGWQS